MGAAFEKNYEIVSDGPPAMEWDEYSSLVKDSWDKLLRDPATHEPEVHAFLEQHPCLIPGYDAFNNSNEPGPVYECVFTKPPLPGITKRTPDFMWLPTDSETQWAVIVELEDSHKRWFTMEGNPRKELSQATIQIASYLAKLSKPTDNLAFRELYGLAYRPLAFLGCLIYGRRAEIEANKEASESRCSLPPEKVKWMTYDRLTPNEHARDVLCVKIEQRKFVAVTVPPTLKMDPGLARRWQSIEGKADAARRSLYFSDARRDFICNRFVYWDDWARRAAADPFETE